MKFSGLTSLKTKHIEKARSRAKRPRYTGYHGRTEEELQEDIRTAVWEAERELKTKHIEEARSRAKRPRYTGYHGCTEEELQEDIRTAVWEAERELIQGRLGSNMRRRRELRISVGNQSETRHGVSEGEDLEVLYWWMDKSKTKPQLSNTNVITLTGLEIFPKVGEQGGETIVGTLEVQANRFCYATSSHFCFSFLHADVKNAFFRVGDEKTSPLLHFHFHEPVNVGTEKMQNIQFRLVQTPVGQNIYDSDSDKTEKDKRNKDLKNFVHDVVENWRYVPVFRLDPFVNAELHRTTEFQGNLPSKAPTVFGLTFSALVGLVDEPFVVVNLKEIEFVSLWLKPVEMDMTIVFQDLKLDVVKINSIPIHKLDLIKDICTAAEVKYYAGYWDSDYDWGDEVKHLADSPRNFDRLREHDDLRTQECYSDIYTAYCRPDCEGKEYLMED